MKLGKNGLMVKSLIEQGYSVEYGKLCICNLADYIQTRIPLEKKYQVVCSDSRLKCSEIYMKLDLAIDKFMGLKYLLDKKAENVNLSIKPVDNSVPSLPVLQDA